MRRRDFLKGIIWSATGWSFAARAQQSTLPAVGFLNAASPNMFAQFVPAFRVGLNEMGYVEGRNVIIEYRWAGGQQYDRLPALAAELVDRRVSVIATGSNTVAAKAAKAATTTIPIVFLTGADPVKEGLVTSLPSPGANLTGITTLNVELGPKRFELLHELAPTSAVLGVLINPINHPTVVQDYTRDAEQAAHALGLQIDVLHASTERELESAFSTLVQRRAGGLVITADAFFSGKSVQIATLASRYAIPSISPYREFVTAGGLMSYGGNIAELYRLVGVYTGRILKGEQPANLPVQQVTKVELAINLKTAKALGLALPQSLVARADEVIE
jgi:putative tryptophan/tyrosine transport system substrate-binding protein